jgi:hypothetical protein
MVKDRDGQVAEHPIYAAIGCPWPGEGRAGLWAGTGGEGVKFWVSVFTHLRRAAGVEDAFLVCDGLKALAGMVRRRLASRHGPGGHHPLSRRADYADLDDGSLCRGAPSRILATGLVTGRSSADEGGDLLDCDLKQIAHCWKAESHGHSFVVVG